MRGGKKQIKASRIRDDFCFQGVSFPAIHVMVAKWAPPNERSVLASIAYAGT